MVQNLHDSAKEGNLKVVQELLDQGFNVNLEDEKFGKTPLCWAAEYGHWDVAQLLLNHGADFALADSIGRKPLLWAARHGHERVVQLLLDKGDRLDSRDRNGRTSLLLAAREGHMEVVKLLIKFGDNVDAKDMKNRSALSFAAENGYLDVVSFLVVSNCEIDSRDSNDRTPLSWAAENGDEEVVRLLLAKGASVNSKDKNNRTPLSYASEFGHTGATETLLEDDTIEYDFQDIYYDQTPLSWAAEGGHDDIVSLLLERGADADTRDRAGHTPLLWAIRNGHEAVVKLLVDQEVEVIVRDEENWTPLSLAAYLGDKPLTERLLLKAVELNSKVRIAIAEAIEDALWRANESLSDAKDDLKRAQTDPALNKDLSASKVPFFGLSKEEVQKAEEELSQAKERRKVAHETALNHEAVVNLIIENPKYLHIKDYKERTLLSWAAENGHDAVLKLLLSRELSPHSVDQLNRKPISWAAKGGHESTVVILLDENVQPDWRDGAGRTPLSLAAGEGHEAVVKLLLDVDADPTTRVTDLPLDVKKKPAAFYSALQGSSDDLDINAAGDSQFDRGVDFDSRDNSGQTPLLFAAKDGHGKVVSLLLDKGANLYTRGADNKSLWQLIEDQMLSAKTDKFKLAKLQDVLILVESRLNDGQLLTAPLKEKASVDSRFKAIIVHFLATGEGTGERDMFCRYCPVLDLLEGKISNEVEAVKETKCKWLHVPANNMRWIEIIMAQHYKELQDRWKHNIVLQKELWTGLQHRAPKGIHHARFMRPTCQALPIHSSSSTGIVLFMPYLHWETEENVDEMKAIIRQHEMAKEGKEFGIGNHTGKKRSPDYHKNQQLIKEYLDDKHPLHIRRTLDQFYYHTLKDTDARDKDQTGARYHESFKLEKSKIVTMVDQLWLWVLPGFGKSPDTVITSFPQRSNRVDSYGRRNDEKFTSLFSNIMAQTQDHPVENGHELAEIISSECSRIYFDTMTDRDRSLQFLEIYATSIGEITDKETRCFQKFQDTLKLSPDALKNNKAAESALSITEEIKLLQEVKDIRDELNIMLSVFNAQRKALKDMARIRYKTAMADRRTPGGSPTLSRAVSWGMDPGNFLPLSTVDSNISEVEEMDKYAERAYMALNHLLDLKQKQANVSEAQATHKLIKATSSQGKMITFFTLITIVFMPLSFMAAFFAINIAEFPRDANGLSLGYVSKYMFSISAGLIIPSIVIAFNLQNIEDYLKKLWKQKLSVPVASGAIPTGGNPGDTDIGLGEMPLEALEAGGRTKQKSLEQKQAEGIGKQKLLDEEQGRKSANSSL